MKQNGHAEFKQIKKIHLQCAETTHFKATHVFFEKLSLLEIVLGIERMQIF